ncbi:MAG: hypothetical protein RLZZ524_2359 [Pseudomonadota bacterium]|jgi:hypothetical protein
MHSLETINKLNYEAWRGQVETAHRAGNTVVLEYAGVDITGIHVFEPGQSVAAVDKFEALNQLHAQSTHAVLLRPPAAPIAAL